MSPLGLSHEFENRLFSRWPEEAAGIVQLTSEANIRQSTSKSSNGGWDFDRPVMKSMAVGGVAARTQRDMRFSYISDGAAGKQIPATSSQGKAAFYRCMGPIYSAWLNKSKAVSSGDWCFQHRAESGSSWNATSPEDLHGSTPLSWLRMLL